MDNPVEFKGYILGYHKIHIYSSCDWHIAIPDTKTILEINGYEMYGEWEKFKQKYGDPYSSIYFDKDFVIINKPVKALRVNRLNEIEC